MYIHSSKMKNVVVSIVGNIGSGKTTFGNNLLTDQNGYKFFQEPVDVWTNMKSNNLLKLFYDEPRKYCLPFQMTVLASFRNVFSQITKSSSDEVSRINFLERSHLDGLKVFAPTLVEGGLMSSVEFDTLSFVAESMFDENDRVDGYVYLRTDPELCFGRVKSRSRGEESSVNLCYLRSLNEKYEDWMFSEDCGNVLVIDNNVDRFSEQYTSYAKQVDKFVSKLCNETCNI